MHTKRIDNGTAEPCAPRFRRRTYILVRFWTRSMRRLRSRYNHRFMDFEMVFCGTVSRLSPVWWAQIHGGPSSKNLNIKMKIWIQITARFCLFNNVLLSYAGKRLTAYAHAWRSKMYTYTLNTYSPCVFFVSS